MNIVYISNHSDFKSNECVLGLGYFDGVHLGHQLIVDQVKRDAKKMNCESAMLTFDKPLKAILNKPYYGELTPIEIRLKIFEEMGIETCYVLNLDLQLVSISPIDFLNNIVFKTKCKQVVCGSDYHFGFKGEGDVVLLSQIFPTKIVDFKLEKEDLKISSSSIIKYIIDGDIETANKLLGKEYTIEGKVVHGLGNGKKLGFPTANIDTNGYVIPKNGVYQVYITIDGQKYKGICNIGKHPTIEETENNSIETYIFEFNKDIYGQSIKLTFHKYLRDEMKFDDIEDLKRRIKIDTFSKF